MKRGKFLDNDTQLFIFILILSQLHPRDPENRQQNRFSERRFPEKTSYNRLNGKAWLICENCPVRVPLLNRGKESNHIRIINIFFNYSCFNIEKFMKFK